MNDSKIKVLLVEPEKYPKEIVIDDSLEAMQEVVGGNIEEYMPYDDDVAIICNEEGKMRGLPLNRAVYVQDNDKKEMVDIICGKFFICYAPPESESFQSLPDDMMKKYKEQFKYPERCALPGFVDSKNEEKTERNAGYLVVSHSGGGMLRQGTRKGIRRTPANRGMRAHWVVKGLDISEDVCHGMCP